MQGHNVLFVTLEDSKEACMFKQIALMSDITLNTLQSVRPDSKTDELKGYMPTFKEQLEKMGNFWIVDKSEKEFRVSDLRAVINEIGVENLDAIYVDYIGKIMPSLGMKTATMYEGSKEVAASLRRLAMETAIPMVTAAQINRGGMKKEIDDLDMDSISESVAIVHSADLAIILANHDDTARDYLNERLYKIVKNRIAGKHGFCSSFYWDLGTLKIFDKTEIHEWIDYAKKTGDNRDWLDGNPNQGKTTEIKKQNSPNEGEIDNIITEAKKYA
ncbi:DnaB-like helicase C-terminal domain-containing protein [Pseudodesulfovibrio sediminis]|nr:DnaB-like helicase C-terminal domain-containing protein [Pseudodesulfovibrio sediminis]